MEARAPQLMRHNVTRSPKGDLVGRKVYGAIVQAIECGTLSEPFGRAQFRQAYPGLGDGTYNSFLDKHAVGNPGGNSELFERVSPGSFHLVRPLKYGF